MKLFKFLIDTNLFISLGALVFTMESQVQLGIPASFHPYLFIIFFATLFEYNLHRLVTLVYHKNALQSPRHQWLREHTTAFYALVAFSVTGFLVSIFLAKKEVLLALLPIAALTLFYTLPIYRIREKLLRLREIPGLKIFMIAFVWAAVTVLLPVIQSGQTQDLEHITWMIAERFFFIFAITVPFDIRDIEVDKIAGLKTIPIMRGEKKSWRLAKLATLIFMVLSAIHYTVYLQPGQVIACSLTGVITLFFLNWKKARQSSYYHYGILDGTILLQGVLSLLLYFMYDFI